MLSIETYSNWENYAKEYQKNEPTGHVVIENFLNINVAMELARELRALSALANPKSSLFEHDHHPNQVNKFNMRDVTQMPVMTKTVTRYLNSEEFLHMLCVLSNKGRLWEDARLDGSGVHIIKSGGKLGMHKDFNSLGGERQLFRKLNLLIYMNELWDKSWKGDLLLEVDGKTKNVEPLFNRAVIFNTEHIVHGHPEPLQCPEDISRNSLAFYYYDDSKPTEFYDIAQWRHS